ncbi:PAS domain-containing sensor histidine kinase [Oxalobacteraceae bacterium R-40]|uniref:histidine kinase n=1 Tax=Keguizhuia sedimenti TaxID=3064264 RepID=A0ABU1BJR0_9BURK|nr:PAS domain-containing sensor histidine kinase [Oxalobacteraceae bacterium R-40]
MTRIVRYFLIVGGAMASIVLFLLASAAENSAFFDQHYPWLLGLNALIAVSLLTLVVLLLTRLYKRYKRGKFGSRLMARLVLLFAMVGILPGTIIYLVSVQFVSRSIESWFDVRVESALESGLNLGRTALDSSLADLNAKARSMALELSDLSESEQITQLSRLRDQSQMQEALIVTASGRILASVGGTIGNLVPDLPNAAMLQQARVTRSFATIESISDGEKNGVLSRPSSEGTSKTSGYNDATNLRMRIVVAIPKSGNGMSLQNDAHFLQLLQPVPSQLASHAEALRTAYSEYQERAVARTGLRKIYIVTLTLTLLLAIFGAIASAFLIASNLAKPLLLLAEGTKAVAEGNFSPRPIIATPDELGTLTQSFNTMTRQLYDAHQAVEKNRTELQNAKAYLESVLGNMSAGVMVLDGEFKLVTCNQSVELILLHDCTSYIGKQLNEIASLAPFADAVMTAFSQQSAQSAAGANKKRSLHWQKQIEIPRPLQDAETEGNTVTLLVRGSRLPLQNGVGYVIVFDDISDVISAQRSIAWGEVARRLAHEIKNPLTPIQLSAERLQMKLEGKLAPQDAVMLNKGTSTIVNQVAAMKRMVDDFRDYAKTPPAVLAPLDLNALIEEILGLYTGDDELDMIHADLSPNLPLVMGDATQLRQVVHNLLQNAQDAILERMDHSVPPRIDVSTQAIHYADSDGSQRIAIQLSVLDNGPGFAPKIMGSVFEPYVTSKPRGTGLGLAVVRKIIEEHGGRIDIHNRQDAQGAAVIILFLKLASASA